MDTRDTDGDGVRDVDDDDDDNDGIPDDLDSDDDGDGIPDEFEITLEGIEDDEDEDEVCFS